MDFSYFPYAALSCMFFLTFYRYVSPVFSEYFFPVYLTLAEPKQIEWNTRTSSTLHASIVSVLCLYTLIYDDKISEDPVWGDSKLVKYNCAIVVGYMIADSLIVLKNYRLMGECVYLFHHATSIYAFYVVMTYGCLSWFANFRLIAEFSTPFVNQRWFLDVMSYPRKSRLFLLNGITMAAIFFLARVASIPPYWYNIFLHYGPTSSSPKLGWLWVILISTCFILDALNLFWFYRIFQGACRIYRTSQKNSSVDNVNIVR